MGHEMVAKPSRLKVWRSECSPFLTSDIVIGSKQREQVFVLEKIHTTMQGRSQNASDLILVMSDGVENVKNKRASANQAFSPGI